MAHVEEIYVASRGSEPMRALEEVQAVADGGLEGDRYLKRTGYWTGVDECQVTLIEAEALDEIREKTTVRISNGEHRRNIITRGIELTSLVGARFKIGDALFEFDRPRPPCRYIQSVTEHGMTKALGGRRGGICARVLVSGTVKVGDDLEVQPVQKSAHSGFRLFGR